MIWNKYNLQVNDWDGLLMRKFMEHGKRGGTFCDVGACNGLFTGIFKSLAGPDGMVYSFEMNPNNYANVKNQSAPNCIVENKAVSDGPGRVPIYAENKLASNFTSNIMGHSGRVIGAWETGSREEYLRGMQVESYMC